MMSSTQESDPESESARHHPLVVFGEVLFDCFESGERRLGGAAFNVAWGLTAFGERPLFVSAVGQDEDGDAILDRMQEWGMLEDGLQELPGQATGKVKILDQDGEPDYQICSPRAWDFIENEGFVAGQMLYHGSLALRSEVNQRTLSAMVEQSSAKRFYDVNLRPPHTPVTLVRSWLRGADWVKLNLDELKAVSGESSISLETAGPAIDHVIAQFAVHNVLLTAGSDGAWIRGEYGEARVAPAPEVDQLKDTVGAGDAFTAVTIHGILSGWETSHIVEAAGSFAAKVCGLNGATTSDRSFYQI